MTAPVPAPEPGRARRPRRPLVVPPTPLAEQHRARIGANAIRGCWDAHRADSHEGRVGIGCRTCSSYATALTDARIADVEHSDAFEVPTSAANAYATAVRPAVGGIR